MEATCLRSGLNSEQNSLKNRYKEEWHDNKIPQHEIESVIKFIF